MNSQLITWMIFISSSVWGKIDPPHHYGNEWVVRMRGGPEEAQLVAIQNGYEFIGPLRGLKDTYLFEKSDHPLRSKRSADHLTVRLSDDDRVEWAEQLGNRYREKRGLINVNSFIPKPPSPDVNFPSKPYEIKYPKGWETKNNEYNLENIQKLHGFPMLKEILKHFKPHKYFPSIEFNDKLWSKQWYLHNDGREWASGRSDMNVVPCYANNITGHGVRVVVVDDGLEGSHPDLKRNYDPSISYDMNDDDPDPSPRYDAAGSNAHGTRCAGEISMAANNEKCGIGVAFNSRIGGIRMLDGKVNDKVEAESLGFAYDKVDIYSSSWGPTDDGQTTDGPGKLLSEMFELGISQGRKGKGSIYVWAGGNGGGKDDNCGSDGYVQNIYTLAVSSASQSNQFPWYGEKCAAILTTAYSSGNPLEKMVSTTDIGGRCTIRHSGTSAAAPIAAGIVALLLEYRPDLTWRDVQHIIVRTSRPRPLLDNEGWRKNGAGLWVNTRFGFGLMDAYHMLLAGDYWQNVPPAKNCSVTFNANGEQLPTQQPHRIKFPIDCKEVNYLEHVQLTVDIDAQVRGELEVALTSPQGTRTELLYPRKNDKKKTGLKAWTFSSVLHWNERPRGTWVVELKDHCRNCTAGTLGNFTLKIHGTTDPPHYLEDPNNEINQSDKRRLDFTSLLDYLRHT